MVLGGVALGEQLSQRLYPVRYLGRLLVCYVTARLQLSLHRAEALLELPYDLGRAVQPLVCARSVLRLAGDRAAKKLAHWQGIARAAAEQSGRTRVPALRPVHALDDWLADESLPATRWLLSPRAAQPIARPAPDVPLVVLSGPEGGLDGDEEARALAAGFVAVSLGARILRADTAPLAVLAWVTLGA